MPQKGISKKIDIRCLICCGKTRAAHLGIDVCRACSVFYRRAEKGNKYKCRATSKNCPIGPNLRCKRCRFDHIKRLLGNSEVPPQIECMPSASTTEESASPPPGQAVMRQYPSISNNLPILERLKANYKTMSWSRLNSEMHARENPPHPLEISLEKGPFFPATCASLCLANRILVTALLEFGSSVFPEYGQLQNKEKWDIAVNMFYRFRTFEGCFRACLVYPDNLDRVFGSYALWWDVEHLENFYNDAPSGDREGAKECMKHGNLTLNEIKGAREHLRRVNPSEDEFLIVVALMFWSFGDMPVTHHVGQLGDLYREEILKELHTFYREEKRLDDYASRLGELMMLLPVFDRTRELKEHFEMLRLLDVLPEDNFTYQLQRTE